MPFLDWVNKNQAKEVVRALPYHLLKAASTHGDVSGSNANNLLIQGDNLLALNALVPFYTGQIKCIYADPPFNTEQAFPDYDDKLEHSQWLSMIYPTLVLQRKLLARDGTLFIHIDDNELGYLITVADEVMGRKNRVAIVSFKQGAATGHKSINPGMVSTTNFIVVYAKDKASWKPNRIFTGRERDKRYGQFIENHHEHFTSWRLITLTKAFTAFKGKKAAELKKELGPRQYEDELNAFVIDHAERVVRTARPDYEAVGEEVQRTIDQSLAAPNDYLLLERPGLLPMYFKAGERLIFYRDKLKEVDGVLVAGEPLTTLWDDLLSNNLHNEGGVEFPKSKKPEALIKRLVELSTSTEQDIVLDAFLGSGTTAAVAHKMNRRWIGIERGDHAESKCLPRLERVVQGDMSGISTQLGWTGGGGFKFMRVAEPTFDPTGRINPEVKFSTLASYVWHFETGAPGNQAFDKPLLGIHNGTAYYLLYNGILGDRRPAGGNVLTHAVLQAIHEIFPYDGPKVVYGETSRLGASKLAAEGITFKQIPYDVKMR
jgi:adenine-specific DNA-methyltransferase